MKPLKELITNQLESIREVTKYYTYNNTSFTFKAAATELCSRKDSMKSFSESSGEEPIDWNKRIDLAFSGKASEAELKLWTRDSQAWVTCACGNLCDRIPRHPTQNYPLDLKLANLGDQFFLDWLNKDFKSAKKTLRKIEKRAGKYLRVLDKHEL